MPHPVLQGQQLGAMVQHALAEHQARRQFQVVSRRAHGDDGISTGQTDLQRPFSRQPIDPGIGALHAHRQHLHCLATNHGRLGHARLDLPVKAEIGFSILRLMPSAKVFKAPKKDMLTRHTERSRKN